MQTDSNMNKAYELALKKACDKLKGLDIEAISINSRANLNSTKNSLTVKYLNKDYIIDLRNPDSIRAGEKEAKLTEKILILHYLINAKDIPLTGKMISFRDIKGANIYYPNFKKRAIDPLVKVFGNNAEGLYKAGEKFEALKENYGDKSIKINIFPKIPVTYVIWEGDDEFDANGTILMDNTIQHLLPGEDIVLAASFGVYALIKSLYS
jgi:hypothetical protein